MTTTTTPQAIAGYTERDDRGYRPRPCAFVGIECGQGVTDQGRRFTLHPGGSVADLLRACPPGVVPIWLCGDLPQDEGEIDQDDLDDLPGDWTPSTLIRWCCSDPGPDWMQDPDRKHFIATKQAESSILRFVHRESGRRVEVRFIAAWFGALPTSPEQASAAFHHLSRRLSAAFDIPLLGTPAMTGKKAWHHTIPRGIRYPILSAEDRALIHATSGQGRIELFAPPIGGGDGTLADLVCMDGRWQYSASTSGLGIGPAQHDTEPTYEPYRPGRYLIAFRVPDGWDHVGLFGVQVPGDRRTWCYPSDPGDGGETWVGDRELLTALWPFPYICPACLAGRTSPATHLPCPEHGWHAAIRERLLLQPPSQTHHSGPLDTWTRKLREMRREITEETDAGRLDPHVGHLMAAAVRSILLNTVGALHRTQRPIPRTASEGEAHLIPNDPRKVVGDQGIRHVTIAGKRRYFWLEPAALDDPSEAPFAHPEWSSEVYERVRARMLLHRDGEGGPFAGMLTLPRAEVVACRTDAAYLACDPRWPDDGANGRLRLKGALGYPAPWPQSWAELDALKHEMTPASETPACCREESDR